MDMWLKILKIGPKHQSYGLKFDIHDIYKNNLNRCNFFYMVTQKDRIRILLETNFI